MISGEEKATPSAPAPAGFNFSTFLSIIPVSAWIAVAGIVAAVWYARKDSTE